ncbi:unnamed protein product [Ceutorhynchus assimilis]|uniref:Uncharacterized protein n=1 Tax=Ceutorhynchus assimilis TaxID=467358 RepID=A0A9N9QCC3_9CUCU|nr:unnamed protein product [Ceutorhynchus assimilis]
MEEENDEIIESAQSEGGIRNVISNKEKNIGDSHNEGSIFNELKHMEEIIKTKLLDTRKKAHNLEKRARLKKRTTLKRTSLADKALGIIIKERREWTLSELNEVIYTAASVVASESEGKTTYRSNLCEPRATKLETVQTGYRLELHELLLQTYQELSKTVTEQRLIDQKRVILKNNRLTGKELEQIRLKVAQELNNNSEESDTKLKRKDMEEHKRHTYIPTICTG